MSLFEERDPRFVHLERKVGIFVTLGIAATVSAVVLLGVRQGVFTPRAAVYFRVASADDLSEGAEVLTRGFRIGKVSRLRLDDAGKVEVRLAVDTNAMKWIMRDSTARLSKGLLVGGAKVVITAGTPGAEVIREGGELAFEPGGDLSEAAQQAMADLKPVLRQLTVTIGKLGDPSGDFMTTLANLNRLTAHLDETRGDMSAAFDGASRSFNTLAADLDAAAVSLRKDVLPAVTAVVVKADQTVTGAERTARATESLVATDLTQLVKTLREELIPQVQAVLRSADGTVHDAGAAASALNQELPPILEKLKTSLDTIQAITIDLKQASFQVPALLEEGGTLVQDSEALVKRAGRMWLMPSDDPPPTERTIDVDSYQRRK
jgi:phospholipid/cholesterol/gamma-HCH transport system substrate-binding protein